ncbi:MAG: transketolase family protein [Spirochaetales bacterium]|nr:transketolase family protein [Spirochaetales bacterium]
MKEDIRDSFVQELIKLKKQNDNIAVLVSDSTSTCRIKPFMELFPDGVINVGIAEQNMVGIAAGMALGGMIPITANATPFLMGRSNEQVKTDICYSNTNVKLVGLNPGFAYGSLGPTHHCIDDISTTRSFGNIHIFCPCDPKETRQIISHAVNMEGPVYIRLDSYKAENIHSSDYKFSPGEPVVIKEGKDITIIALGTIIHEVIAAAQTLSKEGIDAEIFSLPSITPLKREKIIKSLSKTKTVLTVEEHSVNGGVGSITGDIILEEQLNCKLLKSGVPAGTFAPASPRKDIQEEYQLDKNGIISNCRKILNRKA